MLSCKGKNMFFRTVCILMGWALFRILYGQNGRKQGNPDAAPDFPGCWVAWAISREVGRGAHVPGKSVAPDAGSCPWGLIASRARNFGPTPPRWRPHPQVASRLESIPASPRVGAGVSGPRERLGPTVPESPGLRLSFFPELECSDF